MSQQILKPLPPTKDSYRYNWGEDDTELCKEYIRELNSIEANKRINIPAFIKRKVLPDSVKLSSNDRAPQLKINDECTKVTGEKGYSMVRATHGINRGKYYFEAHIDSMPEETASRIGWGQCYANLQAPLGYDHYGYSWRSRKGTKFHQARGKTFDKTGGYKEGDTIGCLIDLPFGNPHNHTMAHHLPTSIKETGYIVARGKKDTATKLEERDILPNLESMKPLVKSSISFYKNGHLIGVAFQDILEGFYYPSISLYKSCTVSVNFGPKFRFPPENYNHDSKVHLLYRPTQDMVEIAMIDNFMSDLLYIIGEEGDGETEENKLKEKIKNCTQS